MKFMALSIKPLDDGVDIFSEIESAAIRSSPFFHHRYFSPDELLKISRSETEGRLLLREKVVFSLQDGLDFTGFCICSRLDWDSSYFDMPMARVDFIGQAGVGGEAISRVIKETINCAIDKFDFRHFLCRIRADDYESLNAVASFGFNLVDIQNIYVARPARLKSGGRVLFKPRRYVPEDAASLLRLLSEVSFDSRYTRDRNLPEEKTRGMYRQWMANIVGMPDSEREIYVLEREGRIVAAGAGRYLDFSRAGVNKKIMTDGIFASAKGYSGSYVSIIRALVEAGRENNCPLVELKVSNRNPAANRVLQYLGYENVTQICAFHLAS